MSIRWSATFSSCYAAKPGKQIHAQAADRLAKFLQREFPNAEHKLCEGEPASRIVAHANAHGYDLIMMPTHGLGPFRRFLIGSVTAKVLHDARCPVWTGVHMEETPRTAPEKIKEIFCAVDLGPQSDAALRWAAAVAGALKAKLTLLHAVPGVQTRPEKYFDTEFHAALREEAAAEIVKLQQRVHTSAEVLLVDGEPATAIRDAAREHHASLLVIARGSAAEGFGRLRKHAYDIIRNAPCPTVSV
ncbi:MAG: universal stress protein [Acidobacteria bacterium]|nr:universal stress protein [Acidobacteriota bacterium]